MGTTLGRTHRGSAGFGDAAKKILTLLFRLGKTCCAESKSNLRQLFGRRRSEFLPNIIIIHMRADRQTALLSWMGLVLCLQLIVSPPSARALNPELDISQYAHRAWRVRDGFTRGAILAVAQTPDGYLWLGTEFGLYRFDGIRVIPWLPAPGASFFSKHVYSLLAARDGTLWVGTDDGAASWNNGEFKHFPELDGQTIGSLFEDREGTIWSSGQKNFSNPEICTVRKQVVSCTGEDGSLNQGGSVVKLYEDRNGVLWALARRGIWKWSPGPPTFFTLPPDIDASHGIAEDDSGNLLLGLAGGIRRFKDGRTEPYHLAGDLPQFATRDILRDRDGSLWISTYHSGLIHQHGETLDVFRQPDGLSSDEVFALFEDRENNVWAATQDGLDEFRDAAVATYARKQGLSSSQVQAVLAAGDGTLWIATPTGLDRMRRGKIFPFNLSGGMLNGYPPCSLFLDASGRLWLSTTHEIGYLQGNRFIPVTSTYDGRLLDVVQDRAGDVWMAEQRGGLLHLSSGKLVERIPWSNLGHRDFAISLAADPRSGIWLGFFNGGISHLFSGKIEKTYTTADGLGAGTVTNLRFTADGALLASTDSGLSRLKDRRIATLDHRHGLSCDAVHWMLEDDDHSFWLDTRCGLLRLTRSDIDAWIRATANGQVTDVTVHPTVFDNYDGVRVHEQAYRPYNPPVTKSIDGRIWFVPYDGVSMIDPRHLPLNEVQPPVHIEQVSADGAAYGAIDGLRVPPATRDLTIAYTALSLAVPEKVRFRYKLDGQDPSWKEVVNERQVRYTNLPPGGYTFRVIACNNDGVWDRTGASLRFSIAPAYYQTLWFRLVCVAALLGFICAIYLVRVRHLESRFAARLEARVDERTRIARELHDTLLQSFTAVLLLLKSVSNALPEKPDEAKRRIEGAINDASDAIIEGRDTLNEMRSSGSTGIELDRAINDFAHELLSGASPELVPAIQVQVEGTPALLDPVARDEVFRIATEAIRNAIRHSHALRIDVELRYDEHRMRLRVGDNGIGIDPAILSRDRKTGHWGLTGMRERAKLVGGVLEVWSQVGVGTEIELSIPATSIYIKPPRRWWIFSHLLRS